MRRKTHGENDTTNPLTRPGKFSVFRDVLLILNHTLRHPNSLCFIPLVIHRCGQLQSNQDCIPRTASRTVSGDVQRLGARPLLAGA